MRRTLERSSVSELISDALMNASRFNQSPGTLSRFRLCISRVLSTRVRDNVNFISALRGRKIARRHVDARTRRKNTRNRIEAGLMKLDEMLISYRIG